MKTYQTFVTEAAQVSQIENPRELRTAIAKVSEELQGVNDKFHPKVPLEQINDIFAKHGLLKPFVGGSLHSPELEKDSGRVTQVVHDLQQNVYFHMSWYKMESGNYEIVSYVTTDRNIPVPDLSTKEKKSAITQLNDKLHEIGKKYWNAIPLKEIVELIDDLGFDSQEVPGLLTGADGRFHVGIGSKTYLSLSWHKMETGRWEVVAYAS